MGRECSIKPIPYHPLPWAGPSSPRSGCSKPRPTRCGTLPGMGNEVIRVHHQGESPHSPSTSHLPLPCLSSSASLPAAPGASLNSSQLHIASRAPLLQQIPPGRGEAHTPSSSPREIPNIPAGSMGFFSPTIPGSSRREQRLTVGGGAAPGPGVPGVPSGAGKRSPGHP